MDEEADSLRLRLMTTQGLFRFDNEPTIFRDAEGFYDVQVLKAMCDKMKLSIRHLDSRDVLLAGNFEIIPNLMDPTQSTLGCIIRLAGQQHWVALKFGRKCVLFDSKANMAEDLTFPEAGLYIRNQLICEEDRGTVLLVTQYDEDRSEREVS